MKTPRNAAALRIAVVLFAQALWLQPSHSQDPGGPAFGKEIRKQESIYRSEGEQRPAGYVIDRSLADYTRAFCAGFDRTLASLGPKDRWLDIGAGAGQAILDYHAPDYDLKHAEGRERRGSKAQTVAMSIEDRRTPQWQQNSARLGPDKIQYLTDRRLREYSVQDLGRFRVITDAIGGFSYTEDLSLFMEKVLGFLEVDGSFYTLLQDVQAENGSNRPFYAGSPFLTELKKADGSELRVCNWLKSIACVKVTCELKSDWKPPVEAFRIHKVCEQVAVPALVPVHYEAGTPPERRFRAKN